MSGNNTGGFQPDLFGGDASSYLDKDGNKVTMTRTEEDVKENQARGGANDYPHSTLKEGDDSWHYSNSKSSERVSTIPVPPEETEDEELTGEDRSQPLL